MSKTIINGKYWVFKKFGGRRAAETEKSLDPI